MKAINLGAKLILDKGKIYKVGFPDINLAKRKTRKKSIDKPSKTTESEPPPDKSSKAKTMVDAIAENQEPEKTSTRKISSKSTSKSTSE